ncbi:ATP-grasp domain-containing protein [Streptomyces sp. NPDC001220]
MTDRITGRVEKHADIHLEADPDDFGNVLSVIRAERLGRISGVMTLGYDNPPVVARLAAELGCPGVPVEVADLCTLKDRRIAALDRAGLAVPRFAVATTVDAALAALERVGLPAVVKPSDRTGSLGVAKLDARESARGPVERALALSPTGRVVLEEYLSGTEHTVAGFAVDGLLHVTGFADREYGEKERFFPHFFEGGDTLPSVLDAVQRADVVRTVQRGVDALGLTTAVVNTDILRTADGRVYLLEITCRLTGARIATEVMPLATGVDPLPNAVRLALGRPLVPEELRPTRDRAVVQRYLPADGGTVDSVGDLDALARTPGVHDVFWGLDLAPGTVLPAYRGGDEVLAGTITSGPDVAAAEALAARVLSRLPLRLTDPSGAPTTPYEPSH